MLLGQGYRTVVKLRVYKVPGSHLHHHKERRRGCGVLLTVGYGTDYTQAWKQRLCKRQSGMIMLHCLGHLLSKSPEGQVSVQCPLNTTAIVRNLQKKSFLCNWYLFILVDIRNNTLENSVWAEFQFTGGRGGDQGTSGSSECLSTVKPTTDLLLSNDCWCPKAQDEF